MEKRRFRIFYEEVIQVGRSNPVRGARTRKQYRCHRLKALCINCLRVFCPLKFEECANRWQTAFPANAGDLNPWFDRAKNWLSQYFKLRPSNWHVAYQTKFVSNFSNNEQGRNSASDIWKSLYWSVPVLRMSNSERAQAVLQWKSWNLKCVLTIYIGMP